MTKYFLTFYFNQENVENAVKIWYFFLFYNLHFFIVNLIFTIIYIFCLRNAWILSLPYHYHILLNKFLNNLINFQNQLRNLVIYLLLNRLLHIFWWSKLYFEKPLIIEIIHDISCGKAKTKYNYCSNFHRFYTSN